MSRGAIGPALALLAIGAPVAAQPAEARRYFDAGNAAYDGGQYELAATAYEEAYQRDPRPETTFSAAQAYRRQYFVDRDPEWLRRARALYTRYLEEMPAGGRREHVVTHLQTIELLMAREAPVDPAAAPPAPAPPPTQLMVTSRTPGALVSLDGGPPAPAPAIREVAPGPHLVAVASPGFRAARERTVAVEGRLVVAAVDLAPIAASLRVRAPEGATVAVDGRAVGEAPLARPLSLPAGQHRIVVTRRGHHGFGRVVQLRRAERASVDAVLPSTRARWAAWGFLGAGGLSLGAAAVTGTLAIAAQERAGAIRDEGEQRLLTGAEGRRYGRERERRDELRDASFRLGAAALVLAGAAIAIWALDGAHPPDDGAMLQW